MSLCYLRGYNLILTALWSYVLHALIKAPRGAGCYYLWENSLKTPLLIAQTAAILEIFHAIIGLVKSPVGTTAVQVVSRLHVVWLVYRLVPSCSWTGLVCCAGAWSMAELIRYPYYFFESFPRSNRAIRSLQGLFSWLRYSGFVVLYPIGIFGEVQSIIHALSALKVVGSHWPMAMPNELNFEANLHTIYLMILLCYVPGSVWLYVYMLNRRNRKIGKTE